MKVQIKGSKCMVEFDIDEDGRTSSTGKSNIHFTTGGFQAIPNTDKRINVTVIGPKQ